MLKRRYKKGIKVCYKNDLGKYQSASLLGKNTNYELKKWTERTEGNGPFAVFDGIKNAKLFIRRLKAILGIFSVFKCKYKKSKEKVLYYVSMLGNKKINNGLDKLPEGTILADRVKILKEVK